MNEHAAVLKKIPLFKDLSDHELETVEQITILRAYRKKTVIFSEGSEKEAVYFIQSGLIKAFKTDENGNEQIVSFLHAGDMFPHTGFFNTNPYPATAEALADTKLLAIPVRSFEILMLSTPTIAIKVMRVLGAKIQELQTKLQELTGQDVHDRFLSFLLHLAQEHGKPVDGAIHIALPMTNQEMANAIGTTRESVNRLMNQLRKTNLVENDRNKIIIRDLTALQNFHY